MPSQKNNGSLDIATQASDETVDFLNWVGMEKVELPFLWKTQTGEEFLIPAHWDVGVSLNKPVRGIHMSRIYTSLQDRLFSQALSFNLLQDILEKIIREQEGLSSSGQILTKFNLPLKVPSLLSQNNGWRYYPVQFLVSKSLNNTETSKEIISSRLQFELLYSSTCPCSAELAKQTIMNQFTTDFSKKNEIHKIEFPNWLEKNMQIATPHAQRSRAQISVGIRDHKNLVSVEKLISLCEKALGTPVQAVVKRMDEQEFARLNGSNKMFCEDAARRLSGVLKHQKNLTDCSIKVEHQESLHAHNAVAKIKFKF